MYAFIMYDAALPHSTFVSDVSNIVSRRIERY